MLSFCNYIFGGAQGILDDEVRQVGVLNGDRAEQKRLLFRADT